MHYKLSLHESDRERYGGPEWLEFTDATIDDAPADELERIEAELLPHGVSLIQALAEWRHNLSARSVRVVLWLALQQSGVTVAYDEFVPKVMVAQMRNLDLVADPRVPAGGGDADPPAPAEETSASPSASSTPPSPDSSDGAPLPNS